MMRTRATTRIGSAPPRKGSRPRRAGGVQPNALTLDAVVDAALAITRRAGLPALTVRAVADELGVTGPALYYHVPGGKPALIDLVIDRVTAAYLLLPEPQPDDTWIDRVVDLVAVVCAAEADYPGVMHLTMSAGENHVAYVTSADTVFRILVDDAGFPPEIAVRILDGIIALVVGWIDHKLPTPAAASDLGFELLAEAVTLAGSDEPGDQLRTWVRALLHGFDDLRQIDGATR